MLRLASLFLCALSGLTAIAGPPNPTSQPSEAKSADGVPLPPTSGAPIKAALPDLPISIGIPLTDVPSNFEVFSMKRASSRILDDARIFDTPDGGRIAYDVRLPLADRRTYMQEVNASPTIQGNWVTLPYAWWARDKKTGTMVGLELIDGYVNRVCWLINDVDSDKLTSIVGPLWRASTKNRIKRHEIPPEDESPVLEGDVFEINTTKPKHKVVVTVWTRMAKGEKFDAAVTVECDPVEVLFERRVGVVSPQWDKKVGNGIPVDLAKAASHAQSFFVKDDNLYWYTWSRKWKEYRIILRAPIIEKGLGRVETWEVDDPESPRWSF